MLCTRMRLTERRFRIKSSISYQNGDGECERATVSTESRSPFVRPCAIIKMFDSDNADVKKSNSSSRSSASNTKSDTSKTTSGTDYPNKTDIHGSQTNLDRSDDNSSQKRIKSCSQPSFRAPLIVVTLFLPSEAKTLAPIDVKRDLRRPPSFCQKFQRNNSPSRQQCKCKINAKPDLMLRGKEITETSSNLCTLPPQNQDNDDILRNDDKTTDECIACSACIIEIGRRTPSLTPCVVVDEAALDTGFDKYHMDSFGNLTKNLEIPYADDIDDENDDSLECMSIKSRPGSADTSRIIRITLNNKTSIDGNKPNSDEDRNVVPTEI